MNNLKEHFITVKSDFKEGRVIVLRQRFEVKKKVNSATLYSTALGIYEARINRAKVGSQVFAPGYTYYPYRLLYEENSVGAMLKEGENELLITLNGGWYCGRYTFDNKTQIYGEKEAVSFILTIEYEDGEKEEFYSSSLTEELTSPWDYAGFYDGEVFDGKRDILFKENCIPYSLKEGVALEPTLCTVEYHETLFPQKTWRKDGVAILDFGQNHAGVPVIDTSLLKEGEIVTIRSAEILDDGKLYRGNLRKAKSIIVYKKGRDYGEYTPSFTYMGYRYLEISGVDYREGLVKSRALYTSMERTGYFKSGNEDINKLYNNILWGQKSNYVEIPTDCPQRDERMGYTGDGHVFALTGAYNFNSHDFWRNWLKDLVLGQIDNSEGYIGSTVPAQGKAGVGFLSMLGWGNVISIIPKIMENVFGDEEILKEIYPSLKIFVECEIKHMKDDLWISPSLGDWLSLNGSMAWAAMNNGPVSNSFIVNDLSVIKDLAYRFGYEDDYCRYSEQYNKTRNAWRKMWISSDGTVASDYQSAYVMALKYLNLEGEEKKKVEKKFVENVRRNGLSTGFFGTEHILPLLADLGERELCYDILFSRECPGWLYQIDRGATTPWERWNAILPDGRVNEESVSKDGENMVSFNHYAFGSIGEFLYGYVLGIRPFENGFGKVLIAPLPDKRMGKVEGEYHSVNGKVSVSWEWNDDEFNLCVDNDMPGLVKMPDGTEYLIEKGKNQFSCKF